MPKNNSIDRNQEQLTIVFLDIDGVLLPFPKADDDDDVEPTVVPPPPPAGRLFPVSTVDALAWIFQQIPTAQLVLSSTWRVRESFRNDILSEFAAVSAVLPTTFFDVTDVHMHTERQHEIYHWLQQHHEKSNVAAWIALDDEELLEGTANQQYRSYFQGPHVIHCDHRVGLTMQQAHSAVRMLREQLSAVGGG